MSIIEGSFIKTDEKYGNGVALDEYKDQIKIVRAYEANDGTVKAKWGFPEKNKKAGEKSIPWGVDLGSRNDAAGTLAVLLKTLDGGHTEHEAPKAPPDDQIPF